MCLHSRKHSVAMGKAWDAARGATRIIPEMEAQTSAPATATGEARAVLH